MSIELLGIFLDIIVIGFLAAMIHYAMRLSRSLADFRAQRQEFDTIMIKLMANIDQAERSIQNLKQVSAKETTELQQIIRQSKALSEELQIINEAGESMAKRLEALAEKNRRVVQGTEREDTTPAYARRVSPQKTEKKQQIKDMDYPSFIVKDPDFRDVDRDVGKGDDDEKFQSQAERELYNALRRGKKNNP